MKATPEAGLGKEAKDRGRHTEDVAREEQEERRKKEKRNGESRETGRCRPGEVGKREEEEEE